MVLPTGNLTAAQPWMQVTVGRTEKLEPSRTAGGDADDAAALENLTGPQKVKHRLTARLTNPTCRYVPKAVKTEAQTNVHTDMLIAALFTAAKSLGKNPTVHEQQTLYRPGLATQCNIPLAIKKGLGASCQSIVGGGSSKPSQGERSQPQGLTEDESIYLKCPEQVTPTDRRQGFPGSGRRQGGRKCLWWGVSPGDEKIILELDRSDGCTMMWTS